MPSKYNANILGTQNISNKDLLKLPALSHHKKMEMDRPRDVKGGWQYKQSSLEMDDRRKLKQRTTNTRGLGITGYAYHMLLIRLHTDRIEYILCTYCH